jgi:hypothetical protein
VVASGAIGFALSVGLVWWERANELSIRNLGPIAIGFAILFLCFVMYQSIKVVGGTWAGAGIAIGASILIARMLQLDLFVDPEVIQTVTVAALVVGIFAFILHSQDKLHYLPYVPKDMPDSRRDMADLYRQRHLSDRLSRNMRNLRKQANNLSKHPADSGNILLQLKRMLPAEGYLTERMAQLRAKAHQIRNGHVARLEETREIFSGLPVSEKKKASAELAARYNQLIDIDTRLERLDRAVAENERRIKDLTGQAQRCAASCDNIKLAETLKAAEKLQKHNSSLFSIINRTENKLANIARKVASETKKVNRK